MLDLIMKLMYGVGSSGLNNLIWLGPSLSSDNKQIVISVVAMVLMAVSGTVTVYLFNVFLSLIQRMLNREQVIRLVDILYNFIFGKDFISTLSKLGLNTSYAYSIQCLAQIECIMVGLYFFVSLIYFFICLMKKNKRNILQEVVIMWTSLSSFLTDFGTCFWGCFNEVCTNYLGIACILFILFGILFSSIYKFSGHNYQEVV